MTNASVRRTRPLMSLPMEASPQRSRGKCMPGAAGWIAHRVLWRAAASGYHDASLTQSDMRADTGLLLEVVTFAVIFAGLMGAITWDLITWYYGIPSSSSHALIGGLLDHFAPTAHHRQSITDVFIDGYNFGDLPRKPRRQTSAVLLELAASLGIKTVTAAETPAS